MTKRYDERMIQLLLDRYERSSLSEGRNQRTVHITQKLDKKSFPEYFDEASLEYGEIHEQLTNLEQAGLVTLSWKDGKVGHILEACVLNPEKLAAAYAFVHRTSKTDRKQALLQVLGKYQESLPVFTAWAAKRVQQGLSIRQYAQEDDPGGLDRVLALSAALLHNTRDQYLRSFSIALFHDSKVAEHEMSLAASILTRFECTSLPADLRAEEVFEEFGVFRNPTYIFLKGAGIPADFSEGIGVFQDDIGSFVRQQEATFPAVAALPPEVVLTIENLTSYHQWDLSRHTLGEHELVIYLAGYANKAKRAFLRMLHKRFPAAVFYHFGDIDAGGFRIWKNLAQATGIPIRPYRMDLPTFEQYETSGRPLTPGDRKSLASMREDPFFVRQVPLFDRMLTDNCKLEQEGIWQ